MSLNGTNQRKAIEKYKRKLKDSGLITLHRYVTLEQKLILDAILKSLQTIGDQSLPIHHKNRSFILEAKLKDFIPKVDHFGGADKMI